MLSDGGSIPPASTNYIFNLPLVVKHSLEVVPQWPHPIDRFRLSSLWQPVFISPVGIHEDSLARIRKSYPTQGPALTAGTPALAWGVGTIRRRVMPGGRPGLSLGRHDRRIRRRSLGTGRAPGC